MNFEINSGNEFRESPEGSIKIDRMLSHEEKIAFEEALSGEKEEIHDMTRGQLSLLLEQDIIPNIEEFSPEVQEDLRRLAEIHIQTPENIQELPSDIISYFGLNSETISGLQEDLYSVDLDIFQLLGDFQDYIESNLDFLSPEQKQNIILSLSRRTGGIGEIVAEIRAESEGDEDFRNKRWILNAHIAEAYDFYTQELFPSLEIYSALQRGESIPSIYTQSDRTISSFTGNDYGEQNPNLIDIPFYMEELEEVLVARVDSKGNFREGFFSTQRLLSRNNEVHNAMLQDMGISSLDQVSLLSEEDKKIESEAMFYYLCAVGVQCLPYAGAMPGLAADSVDIFSTHDATLSSLQAMGLVPAEYQMEKGVIDHIFAGAGIILTAVGLQGLARTRKLHRAIQGIQNISQQDIGRMLGTFSERMGFGEGVKSALRGVMGVEDNQRAIDSGIDNIAGIQQRSIRHSQESYIGAGGMENEYGFVDRNGQLHINIELFNQLPQTEKSRVMREFIAHERAHQAILNLPEGRLAEIHQSFIRNNVFTLTGNPSEYGLHFNRAMTPLDTTNEILAHMIGRMRIGETVPENFIQALDDVGIDDITGTFGINASRQAWQEVGGVRNSDNLSEAAMSGGSELENLFSMPKYLINTLKSNPETLRLIDSFHENGPDIGGVVSTIDFNHNDVRNAFSIIKGQFNELLTSTQVTKIRHYLESQGKQLPDGLDMRELRESGDTGVTDDFFDGLITTFSEIQAGRRAEAPEILEVGGDASLGTQRVLEGTELSGIPTNGVREFFEGISDTGTDITEVLHRIDYQAQDSYDLFERNLADVSGIISQERVEEIARSLGRNSQELIADLEFIDGEAGVTNDFLRQIFRLQEERITGIKYTNNPFEMHSRYLSRRVQEVFRGEEGKDISVHIEDHQQIRNAIKNLAHADYHNIDFLRGDLVEIGEFYERFGQEATQKLISEVFQVENVEFSKLFANLNRYDEALQIAKSREYRRLQLILQDAEIVNFDNTMIERVGALEKYIQSDWFIPGDFESLAYTIGRELNLSSLFLHTGEEKFFQLLRSLDIVIPIERRTEFINTIRSHPSFHIAESVYRTESRSVSN